MSNELVPFSSPIEGTVEERSQALTTATGITLAPQQLEAVERVKEWVDTFDGSRPFFYLAGYAGTGKTTIAKELAALFSGHTKFACATAKAARVLTRKGCPASTVHAIIYLPLGDEVNKLRIELQELEDEKRKAEDTKVPLTKTRLDKIRIEEEKRYARIAKLQEPKFILNDDLEGFNGRPHPLKGVKFLVLDEVSMLNEEIAQDLMRFKLPMLVLGDPGQLPPVKGEGYFTNREPDFMLTEIHRQAAENPIIKIATMFRMGKTPATGVYGDSRVTTRFKLTDADYMAADQILCGSNTNRTSLNKKMRALKGFSGEFPQKGERLICLRNNKKKQLNNGQIFIALEDFDTREFIERDGKKEPNILQYSILLEDDEGEERRVSIHPECFTRPTQVAAWDYRQRSTSNEFDFAYAVTVHKAQGSEWDHVLVYADAINWMRDKGDLKKWCYTGSTRAADKLVFAL